MLGFFAGVQFPFVADIIVCRNEREDIILQLSLSLQDFTSDFLLFSVETRDTNYNDATAHGRSVNREELQVQVVITCCARVNESSQSIHVADLVKKNIAK